MSGNEILIREKISDGLNFSFLKFSNDSQVYLELEICDPAMGEFDENRLEVLYLDGVAEIDFCSTKEVGRMLDKGSSELCHFNSDSYFIAGVVWHGLPQEGMGIFARIVQAKSLTLRVYFKDYHVKNFEMEEMTLQKIIQAVKVNFFNS